MRISSCYNTKPIDWAAIRIGCQSIAQKKRLISEAQRLFLIGQASLLSVECGLAGAEQAWSWMQRSFENRHWHSFMTTRSGCGVSVKICDTEAPFILVAKQSGIAHAFSLVANLYPYFKKDKIYTAPRNIATKYPGKYLWMVSSWFPRTVYNCADLKGEALVQGIGHVNVLKIKRFAHKPPWHEGESCGLLIEVLDGKSPSR